MSPPKKQQVVVEQVRLLAWNGKHAQVVALASQELEKRNLSNYLQMDLLDLRAESFIAQGKLDFAMQDANTMSKLAAHIPVLKAQALNRKALILMRLGEVRKALKASTAALKLAHQTEQKPIIGISLLRLAEAQFRLSLNQQSIETSRKAIQLFKKLGDVALEGRAYWTYSLACFYLNRKQDSRVAALTAIQLGQQVDDQLGLGNAWNVLYLNDTDMADAIQHLQQARKYFKSAGYVERQAIVLGNLANVYDQLGLYSQSQRLNLEVIELTRAIQAKVVLVTALVNIIAPELALKKIDLAYTHYYEFEQLASETNDPDMDVLGLTAGAGFAVDEGKLKKATQLLQQAARIASKHQSEQEISTLVRLARVHLASGDTQAALKVSSKATTINRAINFAKPDGLPLQSVWWTHTQALLANHKSEVEETLELAHKFLLESIQSIRDQGLRRNALNKIKENRELLQFWVAHGLKNKLPKEKIFAHFYLESNTREPFTRLTDTSQRLNLLKDIPEIQTFLVEEAVELCGGERVMLILQAGKKLEVAESILPVGEEADEALPSIKKHLTSARLTRTVQLILPKKQGHSRIIAPLIAQNQIVGYLYADMDSIYGLFDDTDRDMLGMLANQAAVALDNAGLVTGLEQKVQERTVQLQESVNETERLLKESQTLANIGRDISSSLEVKVVLENIATQALNLFQGNLSAVFLPSGVGELKAIVAVGQYAEETLNDTIQIGAGILGNIAQNKKAEIVNDTARDPRALVISGTELIPNENLLVVPLLSSKELAGLMAVWRSGVGNEFTENELNFLTNLSRQAVIALKNAQLFSEAEEARHVAEKANRTKSAFLANMSHELRTPLNAIINFTELVTMEIMGPVTDEQKEALGYSLSSSQHLLQLINDVLDISKIQAGKLELFKEEGVDLQKLINETLVIIEPSVQKQAELCGYKMKLIRDVDEDLPLVTCDQRRVKQVLLNLLSNAVKFTEKGSVTLSAKRKDGHILFSVMDTGKGIAPELQAQIFEPFVQTLDGIKHAEGTGLGLPITKSLVEAHGGTIWLESEVGEGSSLFFTLPAY
ncbi:MAG: GAF domain-containing protein [Anaerolineales bacterium]|nr:GAF domain-containing protein [Anaerolineales bacterium]